MIAVRINSLYSHMIRFSPLGVSVWGAAVRAFCFAMCCEKRRKNMLINESNSQQNSL